ncbi:hypothetical protein GT347_20930 [Xylophilus rhododendri]|uniref:Uncharacterized protein n=1 Tax=Xylophilus rhododendri TaxID=2697032 RepID=A0A857J8L6_9BURK|nr:hypothetical protein [Xylophilus rhododendri]QHJ00227.1 hypothetical protein GT347_20930 [Xylophilus rhododendri]
MKTELRRIAVYVDEAEGGFVWVLIEQEEDTWRPLDRADRALAHYGDAMAKGLLALQALVEDLDAGPRTADDAPGNDEPAEDDAPRKPGAFGFGPAR